MAQSIMQQALPSNTRAECCAVICEATRIIEVEHGRIAVLIPRQDLKRITLREGVQAPHPILQIIFGLGLLSLTYFPVQHFIHWARYGGTLFSVEIWVITGFPIGAWLIWTAFRRGLYLEAETIQGKKRLAFQKRPDPLELEGFVKSIEEAYGLRVEKR